MMLIAMMVAAATTAPPSPRKLPGTISARNLPRCVLSGDWPNGQPLQYVAWDRCEKMKIREISLDEARELAGGSRRREAVLASLPKGIRLLEVQHGVSRVLLYRTADGRTQEIPYGDWAAVRAAPDCRRYRAGRRRF